MGQGPVTRYRGSGDHGSLLAAAGEARWGHRLIEARVSKDGSVILTPRLAAADRRCAACSVLLSRYNHGVRCALCERLDRPPGWSPPQPVRRWRRFLPPGVGTRRFLPTRVIRSYGLARREFFDSETFPVEVEMEFPGIPGTTWVQAKSFYGCWEAVGWRLAGASR